MILGSRRKMLGVGAIVIRETGFALFRAEVFDLRSYGYCIEKKTTRSIRRFRHSKS